MISYLTIKGLISSDEQEHYAYTVILNTEQLFSYLKDAETSRRGYVLTGKESYLEPYLVAEENIVQLKKDFKKLINDTVQKQKLFLLDFLIDKKLSQLKRSIELMQEKGPNNEQLVFTDEGKALMDQIRRLVNEFVDKEKNLLKQRADKNVYQVNQAVFLLFISNTVGFALLLTIFYLLNRDIVERKKAEIKLKDIAQDLGRSNAELEQFAYIASHDLQEPLRMVANYLELLSKRYKGKLDKDADEFIYFALDGAKRMQQLIIGLLNYSRVGREDANPIAIDCNFILTSALKNLKLSIEETKAEIISEALPVVLADESQMVQVFQNLISNAIKYHAKSHPHIHITVKKTEDEWIFSVSDNGIGIGLENYERIFKVFQRVHARKEYPGVGIGLASCKKIVERFGGRIWVESELRKWSTFYFSLPVTDQEVKKILI